MAAALMIRIRDAKAFGSAVLFIGAAAVVAWDALSLSLGTASEMGPGYFPLLLAIILGGLGLVLAASGLHLDAPPIARIEWRGLVLVVLAIVAFGATIRWLGFIPAVVFAVGLSMAASDRFRPATAAALIAVLVVFCWAVFVLGLGLPVRLFG